MWASPQIAHVKNMLHKLNNASLGIGLWVSVTYYLCSVIYLDWLRKKELALEKYRVRIAEFVLEERKKLPMVEVDNVEADQAGNDIINSYCYLATIPLGGGVLNFSLFCTALGGLVGTVLCGSFYWSPDSFKLFAVGLLVISLICDCGCYYCWRKLQAESRTVQLDST